MNIAEKKIEAVSPPTDDLSLTKQLVFCYFCERKINEITKVFCQECKDIFICLKCFVEGKEREKHKKSHSFRILNKLDFKLFDNSWTAREELILLDGLHQFGYGNWKDIANHLGSGKDMIDCERHFHQVYLDKEGQLSNYVEDFNVASTSKHNKMKRI
jgi:transcriptional adapter 2-alpha